MDSESRPDQSFELKPETWVLDRVILFRDEAGARVFLDLVYPHFTNCLVVSSDGVFPQKQALADRARVALAEDEGVRIAVFGISALKTVSVKSQRMLVMDELLMQDFKRHPVERALSLGFTPEKLVFVLESFFSQWDRLERIGNAEFGYSQFSEYNQEKFDWRACLLGLSPKTDP
jgi:hypothetical protein